MKIQIILTISHISVVFSPSFSQPGNRDSLPIQFNFFKQREAKERLLKQYEKDTTFDSEATKIKRWQFYWENRVPPSGDFRLYAEKMQKQHTAMTASKTANGKCNADCDFSCFLPDWQFLGPEYIAVQMLGKINCMWVNPNNQNEILAGTDGGLWKSVDNGSNWSNLTDFCIPSIGIFHIAVQPNNSNIIYISTGIGTGGVQSSDHNFGYGVFKTTDGGLSWIKLNINSSLSISQSVSHKILIHPVNFSNIYVLLGNGVYKSINAGSNWTQIFGISQNVNDLRLIDIELTSNSSIDKVYISSSSRIKDFNCNNTSDQYCTCIGSYCDTRYTAKVWEFSSNLNSVNLFNLIDLSLTVSGFQSTTSLSSISITPNSVSIACLRQNGVSIFRNNGSGWLNISNLPLSGFNPGTFPFEVSPSNDNIMYLGGWVIKKSSDGGLSFSDKWSYWAMCSGGCACTVNPSFAGSHLDVRCLYIYNSSSSGNDVLFFGTDGGVSKSTDGGNTTLNLNGKNLQITEFYGISNSEILPNLIYGGTQDNGVFDNTNNYWRGNVYCVGDAYDAVVDVTNPMIGYVTAGGGTGFGPIMKTSNGGSTWSNIGCPPGENCQNKPMVIDKNNNFYVGSKNLWKRNGASWQQITNINTGGREIRAISITDDGNICYIGYSDIFWGSTPTNRVFKITNLNSSPIISDITNGLTAYEWASLTDLVVEPIIGDKIWATFGNLWDGHKVYEYNSQTNQWSNISTGLPDVPVNAIDFYKGSNELLFTGTDDGVYYKNASMPTWKRFTCGLPHAIVSDLEINYNLNRLRAATFGRGIWETPIPQLFEPDCIVSTNAGLVINRINPFGGAYSLTANSGQTHTVTAKTASVQVNYSGNCVGGDCCSNYTNSVKWSVFKKEIGSTFETLYGSGLGSSFSFVGTFRSGIFFTKRYQYRVLISHDCGGKKCTDLEFILRG